MIEVTIPTGISVGENSRRPARSATSTSSAPQAAASGSRPCGRARAAEPAREVRGDEGDEADRPGGGHREPGQHDRGGEQRQPRALDAEAEAAGDVVAEREHVDAARERASISGTSTRERRRERPAPAPSRGR